MPMNQVVMNSLLMHLNSFNPLMGTYADERSAMDSTNVCRRKMART